MIMHLVMWLGLFEFGARQVQTNIRCYRTCRDKAHMHEVITYLAVMAAITGSLCWYLIGRMHW